MITPSSTLSATNLNIIKTAFCEMLSWSVFCHPKYTTCSQIVAVTVSRKRHNKAAGCLEQLQHLGAAMTFSCLHATGAVVQLHQQWVFSSPSPHFPSWHLQQLSQSPHPSYATDSYLVLYISSSSTCNSPYIILPCSAQIVAQFILFYLFSKVFISLLFFKASVWALWCLGYPQLGLF